MTSYFILNFMPLMILLTLWAMMYVNKDVKIPAANYFSASIIIMLIITIISTFNINNDISGMTAAQTARTIKLHLISSTVSYILRPCLILMEVLIVSNNSKYKFLYTIPAVINAVIFSTALFGSEIAFHIGDDNHWYSGPLRPTAYISQLVYLVILFFISVNSFRQKNKRKSIVLVLMFVQAVLVSLLEYKAVEPSYTDSVTALCMLEYYIYLSTVYRQELNDRLDKYVDEIEAAGFRLRRLTTEVIAAFANSIDAKDKYTHGHSSRVAEYARKLAEMNGKGEDQCDEVYYAGLLHDIGKIGISESIITKEGRLTTEEYDMIKQHPTLGAQILGNISEFPYLSIGALYHHERYDGRGYPEGLKGTDIPETARIISVADAYDAMTSRRSYRDPIPQQKVREEIVKGTGTQFDPEYARLMLHLIDDDLEYEMSEHAESTGLTELNEIIIDGYRTSVTDGILINTFMTTISFSLMSDEEATGISPTPSIILFDSLDGKVHTDEKEIADLNYFEYGELMYDMTVNVEGARTIQSSIRNENSGRVSKNGDYVIEAVRIRDHALLRIFGQSMNAEIIIALPDNTRFMYIGFTGDHCCFRDFDIVKSEVESPEGYIPRIAEEISFIKGPSGDIPNVQIDGYRTAHSEGIPVRDGLKFTFHSKCLPTARLVWHCPFIDLFGSDTGVVNDYSYRDLAFMRFDGEFWECDPNCSARLNVIKTSKFQGWDAWKKFNQDGFDTEVLFRVDDNKITVITENAGISIRNTAIIAEVDKTVYAAITGDQVAITNIRIS